VDLAARLDALRSTLAGRQQLGEAFAKGVRTASEFFREAQPSRPARLTDALPGLEVDERPQGRVLVRTQTVEIGSDDWAQNDAFRIPCHRLAALDDGNALDALFPSVGRNPLDPTRIAFLDTETTGLSGGTGTIAFLVGIGWVERDTATGRIARFTLEQLLVEDFAHEPALLHRLAGHLERFDAHCTYNGRGFDVPLLRSRFAMNRMDRSVWQRPNLDLLGWSRRLWKSELGNARLSTIERGVLAIERVGDIDGSLIPDAWHQWARTGEAGVMPQVITHNAQDIASLVAILARQLAMGVAPHDTGVVTRAGECLGLSRWCEKRGALTDAARLCERALGLMPDPGSDPRLLLWLAKIYRRSNCEERALEIWRELERRPIAIGMPAWLEHARHLEHRRKDFAAARLLVHRCVSQAEMENDLHRYSGRSGAVPVSGEELDSLRRRLARLDRRVEKARKAAEPRPPKGTRKPPSN
jgi:uncharacterized protein YprB with RNaseH-like and TPR domain